MNIIIADYRALVEVAEEMEALQECHHCRGTCRPNIASDQKCRKCKGTGLNPDQSKWWEAIGELHVNYNPLQRLIPKDTGIIFCECPYEYAPASTGMFGRYFKKIIHRPGNDNRPWPEVLKGLLEDNIFEDCPGVIGDGCENENIAMGSGCGDFCRNYRKLKDIAFALATPESAPVFKAFDVKPLVEA